MLQPAEARGGDAGRCCTWCPRMRPRAPSCAPVPALRAAHITLTQGMHIGAGADAAERVAARSARSPTARRERARKRHRTRAQRDRAGDGGVALNAPNESTALAAPLAALGGVQPERPRWFRDALAHQPARAWHDVQGARIETLAWGERGRPGLLLLHGKMAHAQWWSFIAPYFAETHRVVALSFGGMGGSDWRDSYSVQAMVDEAMAVTQAEGLFDAATPPVVVGHSFGGFVSLHCAQRHGARLGGVFTLDMPLMSREQRAARTRPGLRQFVPRPTRLYPSLAGGAGALSFRARAAVREPLHRRPHRAPVAEGAACGRRLAGLDLALRPAGGAARPGRRERSRCARRPARWRSAGAASRRWSRRRWRPMSASWRAPRRPRRDSGGAPPRDGRSAAGAGECAACAVAAVAAAEVKRLRGHNAPPSGSTPRAQPMPKRSPQTSRYQEKREAMLRGGRAVQRARRQGRHAVGHRRQRRPGDQQRHLLLPQEGRPRDRVLPAHDRGLRADWPRWRAGAEHRGARRRVLLAPGAAAGRHRARAPCADRQFQRHPCAAEPAGRAGVQRLHRHVPSGARR